MQARRVGSQLLALAIVLVCQGCRTVNASRLVGTYQARVSCLTVTVVMNADHSFVQTARKPTGETSQLMGKWSLDEQGKMVTFAPFLDFSDGDLGRQISFMSFPPELIGRVVEMGPTVVKCSDSEHEINYVK
jgi:hypothetical protein